MPTKKIAVLISGSGSNLQALIDSVNDGYIDAQIALVISNKPEAYGLERAKKAGIPTQTVEPSNFSDRQAYDQELIKLIDSHSIDLVVLAGYMLICSSDFVNHFYGRLINLHPSLLPAFPGATAIEDAFQAKAKVTGVTVHFVDEGCDTGPIIMQQEVEIRKDDTQETLAQKIHEIEHSILSKAVKYFLEGRLKLEDKRVVIK